MTAEKPAALAVVPQATMGLMPALTVQQAAQRYNAMVEFTKTVMEKEQDYGTIPGTDKPCLYKAGAEKLCTLFGMTPTFSLIEREQDWTGKDHNGEPFFYFFYKCTLVRGAEPVGEGDGSCNSWEKKYRWRDGKRKCPNCGAETIFKSKDRPEFYCWQKKGGCGQKFGDKDPSIVGQDVGRVANPDICELVNTLQKIAQKRALIAATLIACNASAFFTQDVEDMTIIDVEHEPVQSETREQVRDRRIAEERAKATAPQGEPRHQAFADIDPEDTPPVAAGLSARPNRGAGDSQSGGSPKDGGYEARATAQAEEAQAQLAGDKQPKVPMPAWKITMLEKTEPLKMLLRELTDGTDTALRAILQTFGVQKRNHINTRDMGLSFHAALVKNIDMLKRMRANIEQIEEIRAKIGDGKFWDCIGRDLSLTADDLKGADENMQMRILERLREEAK